MSTVTRLENQRVIRIHASALLLLRINLHHIYTAAGRSILTAASSGCHTLYRRMQWVWDNAVGLCHQWRGCTFMVPSVKKLCRCHCRNGVVLQTVAWMRTGNKSLLYNAFTLYS